MSRLPAAVEEVVGGRRDRGPVPEAERQAGEEQRSVDVAGVVGREDHRRFESAELVGPTDQRVGDEPGHRPGDVVEDHRPDQSHRIAPRPVTCRSGDPLRVWEWIAAPTPASSERRRGSQLRPTRPASAAGRSRRSTARGRVVLPAPRASAEPRVAADHARGPERGRRAVGEVHCTSAMRIGGTWRWVRVGAGPTTSVAISSASARVERPGTRGGAPPPGRRRPRSPRPGAAARARTSTTCRTGGRRGRRGRSGRGGRTRGRWRRTPRTARASRQGRSSRSAPARRSRCSSGGGPGGTPTGWGGS